LVESGRETRRGGDHGDRAARPSPGGGPLTHQGAGGRSQPGKQRRQRGQDEVGALDPHVDPAQARGSDFDPAKVVLNAGGEVATNVAGGVHGDSPKLATEEGELSAIGYRLSATGYRLLAIGSWFVTSPAAPREAASRTLIADSR